jgi:hypothetical protein
MAGSTDHSSRRTNGDSKKSRIPVNETVAKLRSLLQGLESESILVNRTPRDRKQRVLKIREEITLITRREARCVCNCQQITVAESWFWEEFEAKMSIPCPIHGPCRLGIIVSIMGYPSDGDPRDQRLAELMREYRRRCDTYRNPEFKHDEPCKVSL